MASKLVRSYFPTVAGGGGAPPAAIGVVWGPDFGDASDDTTWFVQAGITLTDLAAVYDKTVGCNIALTDLAVVMNEQQVGSHLSGEALGAPFWQTEAHNALTAAATSITVSVPAGTVDGDLLVAFVATRDAISQDVNVHGSWTAVNNVSQVTGTSGIFARCMRRIASGEPASYTFTFAGSVANATAEIHRVIGHDGTTPIDASAVAALAATALDADPDAPSVTTTVVNTLVFAWVGHDHLALTQTHTPPASHIEVEDYESNTTALLFGSTTSWRVFAAAGATGTAAINCTETVATDACMMRVAIRPGTFTLAP